MQLQMSYILFKGIKTGRYKCKWVHIWIFWRHLVGSRSYVFEEVFTKL